MSQPPGPQGPYNQYPGGGQPPSGGFPQQGPPQGGYGQPQGGYGPPPGPPPGQFGPGGYPPPGGPDPYGGQQKKSPLPWILGGVGALVVIGGVVVLLIMLLGGGGDTGSPEAAAQSALDHFEDRDFDGLAAMTCAAEKENIKKMGEASQNGGAPTTPEGFEVKIGDVKETDDTATAQVNVTKDGKQVTSINFKLANESDEWLFCGFDLGGIPGGGAPPPGGGTVPPPGGGVPPPN